MAPTVPRRNANRVQLIKSLSPTSPRRKNTVIPSPKRTALLLEAKRTAGTLPRKKLFKKYNVSERSGYRVLKLNEPRRLERIRNRGRKPALYPHKAHAMEVAQQSSFRFATATHYSMAKQLSIGRGKERAIQQQMLDYGVGVYRAA